MRIELYDKSALPAIVSLSLRAWTPVFESIEKAMDPSVFAHFFPDWRDSQAKSVAETCSSPNMKVWTASEGDSIVGFVAMKLHQESRMGEIYMVAVDPDHQRKGIGSALMGRAMDWMRESGMAVAMVETGAPTRATHPLGGSTSGWVSGTSRWPGSS